MPPLATDLRNKLEKTVISARNLSEKAAKAALEALAVHHHEPYGHMSPDQRKLRTQLRARARQLGDAQDVRGSLAMGHLVHECAYEHWHRMLFARFLAENNLLIEPEMGVAISLDECKELAKDEKTDLWTLAGRYAQKMLPDVFRADDPVLRVTLAREDQLKLEQLLDGLPKAGFTASDSLGWCYQFWQAERKDQVNAAGNKIGANELPAVTQLFTEDYMVDFLLDNTLGAWHAGKVFAANTTLAETAKNEDELRKAVGLPGCLWKYLRFIKEKDGKWRPAAGAFDGWPKRAKELKCLDPCMGSGHFVVAMFERLVALRLAEEKLDEAAAVAAVIRDNLFGLEIDPRCTQIGAFNLALAAWRRVGNRPLPVMSLACSGLAPNTREADWLAIAGDNEKLRNGMERLYRLFQKAAVLGSLINPRAAGGDLLEAGFHELQPLLEKALAQETKDDTAHEMAVTAHGLAKAAEILAGQFTLVATNVPYLGRGKQDDILKDYCESMHPDSKADLATCFVERSLNFCTPGGSVALVTPHQWLFLGTYKHFRSASLERNRWNVAARLDEHAFDSAQAAGAFVGLFVLSHALPTVAATFVGIECSESSTPDGKAHELLTGGLRLILQSDQLGNPDARISLDEVSRGKRLQNFATYHNGIQTGDYPRFGRCFWENGTRIDGWKWQQTTVLESTTYGGRSYLLRWDGDNGEFRSFVRERLDGNDGAWIRGLEAWGKQGILVSGMRSLPATNYEGAAFDNNATVVVVDNSRLLPALWAFCESGEYTREVRKLNKKISVTDDSFVQVPFDLAHWQKVAAEKYPHGLPKPFSSDPTQWLFNGQPKGSDQPLHVAVARLLGYLWPRQTGSSFPDCPALGPDGLEKLADGDGIVCVPSVRGEEPAAERLRKLLEVAFGKEWKGQTELELIRASGSDAADLEEWLRNDFFEQHCDLFHQRPFVWHIWDGRKRDGFHALVNYHKLAAGDKGRRLLESLTHSYLGEWITRQQDGVKRGEEGAEERLAAAFALKERLEAIIEGEPPYDIFVRWKPLKSQAIGWEPDINDGVRMNIRPFMASDLPNGKKGAGVLRAKPNIKWEKDRGKEPRRAKEEFPWFWKGSEFTGDRVNDVHLTNEQKRKTRKT
jgi:hypothetical protein